MPPAPMPTSPPPTTASPERPRGLSAVCVELGRHQRFLLTSHARPDGDAIGSQLALAYALRALGKHVDLVNRDPVPEPYRQFPGTGDITIAERVEGDYDALVVLECSDLSRPGVAGLDRFRTVNIDHHLGNTGYGAVNWVDESAAACAELVVDIVDALGVPLSVEIATHAYVAILTDTGSFRHSHISARTFDICRRVAGAGVDPAAVARQVFDPGSLGRLRLMGALLAGMRLEAADRLAVLTLDDALVAATGASLDDTEGMINLPLSAGVVEAVVMFKPNGTGEPMRVSLRSKGRVDVRSVATRHGGGGHVNAAGFTAADDTDATRAGIVAEVVATLDR
jgi:bifunctional oligoribonuclease and PAP phosphatase NrnA